MIRKVMLPKRIVNTLYTNVEVYDKVKSAIWLSIKACWDTQNIKPTQIEKCKMTFTAYDTFFTLFDDLDVPPLAFKIAAHLVKQIMRYE